MNENIPIPSPPTNGTGYLIVQVTTANGSIPLSDAAVTIRSTETGEENVLFELRSGPDGRTPRIPLPAPPRAETLDYDNPRPPYSSYSIEVSLPLYGTNHYENVPIFDGITAIQQAVLVPIADNGRNGSFTFDEGRRFDGAAETP